MQSIRLGTTDEAINSIDAAEGSVKGRMVGLGDCPNFRRYVKMLKLYVDRSSVVMA